MFNRRLLLFLAAVTLAMLIALIRLGHLQLVRGADYAELAAKRMQSGRYLDTHRGDIVDRHGTILATDQACYEFRMPYGALLLEWAGRRSRSFVESEAIDPAGAWLRVDDELLAAKEKSLLYSWIKETASEDDCTVDEARAGLLDRVEWTLDHVAAITGSPREQLSENVDGIVRRVQRIRRVVGSKIREEITSHAVVGALDEPAAVDIRAELDRMLGASVGSSTRRWYPYSELACHVIGRLGRVTAEAPGSDAYADDPLRRYWPSDRLGVTGVEKICESRLRGVRGRQVTHVSGDALETLPAVEGRSVALTIDIDLQREITDLLGARPFNGAAVVIDVATGEVLALVSKPTYDLNTYGSQFTRLNTDSENLPLLNRAIGRNYPPGSTVKPITALAALGEGVISTSDVFNCRGHSDPRRPRCWNRAGHGPVALSEAVMNSCNAYFSRVAERMDIERLLYWMRQFGIGERPGTGLPGEAAGLAPTRKWLWERYGRSFYPGDARQMAVGQGLLLATPLQIANVMATIARDGEFLSPVVVADWRDRQQRRRLPLPPAALAAVREGMYRVVNDPRSQTAYRYAERTEVVMCGKTGTAQTPRRPDIAWFAGFAPPRDSRVAFAVVLDYAGSGGSNCVGLAEKILIACKKRGYLDPPKE